MSDASEKGHEYPEARELKQAEAPETREASGDPETFEPTSTEDAPNIEHVSYSEPAGLPDDVGDESDAYSVDLDH